MIKKDKITQEISHHKKDNGYLLTNTILRLRDCDAKLHRIACIKYHLRQKTSNRQYAMVHIANRISWKKTLTNVCDVAIERYYDIAIKR